jgi:DNA-binding beta-propeller fold protein YncE
LIGRVLLMAALLLALAGCGTAAAGGGAPARAGSPLRNAAAPGTHHYEYVFVDDAAYVYDIDHHEQFVQQLSLPGIAGIRGVDFDPSNHLLYISYGGDGDGEGNGSLAAYDLVHQRVVWEHHYDRGIDSFAIGRDGTRIYMPDGELSSDGVWSVLDASNGNVIGTIDGGLGPHNTITGLSGRRVYLGGRNYDYLDVASTRTDRVFRRIGPLRSGVRPFTINGRETLAYTTATGFLGFQVSSIRTGRVLYTVRFGRRFRYDPATFAPSAPSHGIALTPDERQLWVIDGPNSYVHAFAVSRVPRRRPRAIADVRLAHALTGNQDSCSYDCARDGWLQTSRDGCYVFVGDSGDVISTRTFRIVGFVPWLRNSREFLEIDWRGAVPVATSTRSGLGYVRGRHRPRPPRCP